MQKCRILFRAEISFGNYIKLNELYRRTHVRYVDDNFDLFFRAYAGAIDNNFLLKDDNTHSHRAVVAEVYFEASWFRANGITRSICRSKYDRTLLVHSLQTDCNFKSSTSIHT